jgi:hypothetical protein
VEAAGVTVNRRKAMERGGDARQIPRLLAKSQSMGEVAFSAS